MMIFECPRCVGRMSALHTTLWDLWNRGASQIECAGCGHLMPFQFGG